VRRVDRTLSGRHFLKCLKYSSSMNSGKGTFQGFWPGRRTSSGSGRAPGPFEGEHRKDENPPSPRPTVGTFPGFFLLHASPIQSQRWCRFPAGRSIGFASCSPGRSARPPRTTYSPTTTTPTSGRPGGASASAQLRPRPRQDPGHAGVSHRLAIP
jgi:hypothetical protein